MGGATQRATAIVTWLAMLTGGVYCSTNALSGNAAEDLGSRQEQSAPGCRLLWTRPPNCLFSHCSLSPPPRCYFGSSGVLV